MMEQEQWCHMYNQSQVAYLIRRHLNTLCLKSDNKGQASIEFSLAFILALFFLVLTCRLFVWFSGNLVNRQRDYDGSRISAGSTAPGNLTFHAAARLDILSNGIFK